MIKYNPVQSLTFALDNRFPFYRKKLVICLRENASGCADAQVFARYILLELTSSSAYSYTLNHANFIRCMNLDCPKLCQG